MHVPALDIRVEQKGNREMNESHFKFLKEKKNLAKKNLAKKKILQKKLLRKYQCAEFSALRLVHIGICTDNCSNRFLFPVRQLC